MSSSSRSDPLPRAQDLLDQQLLGAAARGSLSSCIALLAQGACAAAEDSVALHEAARAGHADCVALLLPLSDLAASGPALYIAARMGRTDCLRLLAPLLGPTATTGVALLGAASCGHLECVLLLLPFQGSMPKPRFSRPALMDTLNARRRYCPQLLPDPQPRPFFGPPSSAALNAFPLCSPPRQTASLGTRGRV